MPILSIFLFVSTFCDILIWNIDWLGIFGDINQFFKTFDWSGPTNTRTWTWMWHVLTHPIRDCTTSHADKTKFVWALISGIFSVWTSTSWRWITFLAISLSRGYRKPITNIIIFSTAQSTRRQASWAMSKMRYESLNFICWSSFLLLKSVVIETRQHGFRNVSNQFVFLNWVCSG